MKGASFPEFKNGMPEYLGSVSPEGVWIRGAGPQGEEIRRSRREIARAAAVLTLTAVVLSVVTMGFATALPLMAASQTAMYFGTLSDGPNLGNFLWFYFTHWYRTPGWSDWLNFFAGFGIGYMIAGMLATTFVWAGWITTGVAVAILGPWGLVALAVAAAAF